MVYSHHVKKDGGGGGMGGSGGRNHLVIFVQRRNRIKGTTVLGYKNIAACSIDMSLVLQRGSTVQVPHLFQYKPPYIGRPRLEANLIIIKPE